MSKPKGLTKAGTPRQRAERTYFAENYDGSVVKFKNHESRQTALDTGEVHKAITWYEARARELALKKVDAGVVVVSPPSTRVRGSSSQSDPRVIELAIRMARLVNDFGELQRLVREIAGS